ncbi:hypothetical protein [Porphyrobacter sp. AAP60]|uniref:hypothetical protein n=1 Tax=Porphyrobacter sp. AAP60 TaxID=1523423 RepID=UPI0006B9FC3D|nr:hypothetical protein [Porphyrobacter sp. AAP60]KPF63945.1 hypothetical protein IP79_09095 [Porphyrobacter sp. AAP60]
MRFGTFLCGVVALFAAAAANGQDTADAWTDEAIWVTVAETYGFEQRLRGIAFDNQDVRQQIRRAGVMPACRVIADFIDRKADAVSSSYRILIVAEARIMVPEGRAFQEQVSIHPSGHRFGRLVERVERRAPEIFADLPTQIESELVAELAKLPTTVGEWRVPVADWNFNGSNQSVWATACMISNLRDPSNAKGAFDGFYRERPAQ